MTLSDKCVFLGVSTMVHHEEQSKSPNPRGEASSWEQAVTPNNPWKTSTECRGRKEHSIFQASANCVFQDIGSHISLLESLCVGDGGGGAYCEY